MPVYIIRLLTWPTEEEKFTVTSTIINQPSNIVQSASGRWTEADICNSVQNILCARYTIPSPTPSIISVINLTKTYLKAGSIRNSLKFIHINSFRILDWRSLSLHLPHFVVCGPQWIQDSYITTFSPPTEFFGLELRQNFCTCYWIFGLPWLPWPSTEAFAAPVAAHTHHPNLRILLTFPRQ